MQFLESQIATDLAAVATIDRVTTDGTAVALDESGNVQNTAAQTADNEGDGIFTIYFKDMPANVVQN